MADEITFEADVDALIADLTALGEAMQPYVNAASGETASAVDREASARLRRQLSQHATGQTVESIIHEPAYDGNGFIVAVEREPFPNLPLWLEKGTKPGKRKNKARVLPMPYFYVSVELEQGPHVRRLEHAVQRCIDDRGLGQG
jgi:hypothetical protein